MANNEEILEEIKDGLAIADGPAFRGDIARVLGRNSESIRKAVEDGIAGGDLYVTGQNRIALVDQPDEEAVFEVLQDERIRRLQNRWMRVHRFRSWAQEQVTKSSRTGVGVVFLDASHILPNQALCRVVNDWSSPERWFTQMLGQKETPDPRQCPTCGKGEIVGDSLIELEAPNGHIRTFAITFYGHCHEADASPVEDPPLLFAVRLREERASEPAAHPVLGGSTADTGLDLSVSFPAQGLSSDRGPGQHSLDNILASTEELQRRIEQVAAAVQSLEQPAPEVRGACMEVLDLAASLRDDVQYSRDMVRLTSTVRTLRSIFRSNWTFESLGERTVECLGAVTDADRVALLVHKEGDKYEVLGELGLASDRELVDRTESDILARGLANDSGIRIVDVDDESLDDDALNLGASLVAAPIRQGDAKSGLLVVASDETGAFTPVDQKFFTAVAKPIGDALHNLERGTPVQAQTGIDDVTGVFNQPRFFDHAAREFVRARSRDKELSALVFAVDDWDRIANAHSASATDNLLRRVVERAAETLRASDFVGRYAQATFSALLIEVDLEIAEKVADRIRNAVADEPFEVGGVELPVTVSVGAAQMTPETRAVDRLVSRADAAMLKASEEGGDHVELSEALENEG